MSDSAALAKELDELFDTEQRAESRLDAAIEIASESSVDDARDDVVRASDERRARVPAIGAALAQDGGEEAMRAVLGLVDSHHRAQISDAWRGIGGWSG